MKISIKKEILLKPLTHVVGIIEKRQTLPILGNVFIKSKTNNLTIIGTDLETEITAFIDKIDCEDGDVTVSARKLFDIVRTMPDGSVIDLISESNTVVVTSGRAKFTLKTLPPKDFPTLDVSTWDSSFSLTRTSLSSLLFSTQFAMAQQDVRYFLNGLLFEIEPGLLRTVATDGHRLAKSEIAVSGIKETGIQRIVPRKAVLEMQRLLSSDDSKDVEIRITANHISMSTKQLIFQSKLIDGRFPDYNTVIPTSLTTHLEVTRLEMIDILVRAAILSNDKFKGVSLLLEPGVLKVSSNNPEDEHSSDEMPVNYKGESIQVGFNVNYLLDALRNLSTETVLLGLQDANTSCTIGSPNLQSTLYLIMPMRL